MECDQKYAQKGYTSHILRYVTENLPEIDLESLDLTYTGEPIVTPMTDDVLSGFQREVVSLYALLDGWNLTPNPNDQNLNTFHQHTRLRR